MTKLSQEYHSEIKKLLETSLSTTFYGITVVIIATMMKPSTNFGNFVHRIFALQVLCQMKVTNRATTPMMMFWSILMMTATWVADGLRRLAVAITAPELSTEPPIHAPSTISGTYLANGIVGIRGTVRIDVAAMMLVSESLSIDTHSPIVIPADVPQMQTVLLVTRA